MKKLLLVFSAFTLLLAGCNGSNDSAKNSGDSTGTSAASANGTNESKEERNKQAATSMMRAINNQNADEAVKYIDQNAADYGDGTGPVVKGMDSIKAGFRGWLEAFPDYKGENLIYIADGDKVAIYGDWSGTFKKDFMGMKSTGKSFKAKDVDILTFNDAGKITEHRSVQSMESIFQQLGVRMNK
jgi:predicted ester cyclase